MKREFDVVTLDDKEYYIMNEVTFNDDTYVYLSNEADEYDVLIKKLDRNDKKLVIPLESMDEFELACNLLIKNILTDQKI